MGKLIMLLHMLTLRARPVLALAVVLWLVLVGLHATLPLSGGPSLVSAAWAQDSDDGDDSDDSGGGGGGSTGGGSGDNSSGGNLLSFLPWVSSSFERNEVLASGLTAAQRAQLAQLNYRVVQQRSSSLIGPQVFRLTPPAGTSLDAAITQIRQLAPQALVDRNHFYYASNNASNSTKTPAACGQGGCTDLLLIGWSHTPNCNPSVRVGMIDTAVQTRHPALQGQSIELLSARSPAREASNPQHGTAVASQLVGRSNGPVPGLLPRARLVAVDAFHKGPRESNRMDAFDLAAALDMLAQRGIKVINLSFSGPPNVLIENAIKKAQQRGTVLVAAAGNDGPTSAPRYPAAYPDVIAVTAVHNDLNLFRRAVRGEHIALAAPGVDVLVADTQGQSGGVTRVSGTSYASPYVSAAVALLQSNGIGRQGSAAVRSYLTKNTRDLGQTGFDVMFGHGLIQMNAVCQTPQKVAQTTKPIAP
jgi:Subtilase family